MFAGTKGDNIRDASAKGRLLTGETWHASHAGTIPCGEAWREQHAGQMKLTDAQVLDIYAEREAGATQRSLAQKYGVSEALMSGVIRGYRRSHLAWIRN
jgi:hypothetical protein